MSDQRESLTYNVVNIFKFTKLKYFSTNRQFLTIQNFDFLNEQKLNDLRLFDHPNITFNSLKYLRISTNNLHIKNIKFSLGWMEMIYLFKNCIQVQDSIYIENMNDELFFQSLIYLLRNSYKTLKILSFKGCFTKFFYSNQFSMALSNIMKLETFYCSFPRIYLNFPQNFLKNSITCYNHIKSIHLLEPYCNSGDVVELTKKVHCLEELSLSFLNHEDCSFLKILKENHSSSLKIIHFNFKKLFTKSFENISNFLIKCINLKEIYIEFSEKNDLKVKNIFDALNNSSGPNLRKYLIGPNLKLNDNNNIMVFKKFLLNCKSLKKIETTTFQNNNFELTCLFGSAILNCKHILQTIKLINIKSENLAYILPVLKEIHCLKEFNFNCYLNLNSYGFLREVFDVHRYNLQSIYLTDIFRNMSNFNEKRTVAKSISNCHNLKIIYLEGYNFSTELFHLLNHKSKFVDNLEELTLTRTYLDNPYWPLVCKGIRRCKNIKYLNLKGSDLNASKLMKLRSALKSSRFVIEKFYPPNPGGIQFNRILAEIRRYCLFVKFCH